MDSSFICLSLQSSIGLSERQHELTTLIQCVISTTDNYIRGPLKLKVAKNKNCC